MKSHKLTHKGLQLLIAEEVSNAQSVLLETPAMSSSNVVMNGMAQAPNNDDYDKGAREGQHAKRELYHIAQQSQQLHDMMIDNENLESWVLDCIKKAAKALEKVFKAVTYDKGPGQGQLGE